jgi:GAF domain-containing protein/HAMP domain-containing protein
VILNLPDQTIQYIAWILVLIEVTLALYIFVLNPQHNTNRLVSLLLLVVGINSFAVGVLIGATAITQAGVPVILLAVTTPLVLPLMLVITPRLLKPEWLAGRRIWIWVGIIVLGLIPGLLVIVDLIFGTRFYLTGIDPAYSGGFIPTTVYTRGLFAPLLKGFDLIILFFILIGIFLYVALFDKQVTQSIKVLAWVLFFSVGVSGLILMVLQSYMPTSLSLLLTSGLFAFMFGFAGFQQMISERRMQRGNLRLRLTILVLAVTAPLLIAIVLLVNAQVDALFRNISVERLHSENQSTMTNLRLWLESNIKALQQTAELPDVVSMDADRQKPALLALAETHPYMYLVSTTDDRGMNVARSDDQEAKDYADRDWFTKVMAGSPVALQTLIGRTSGQPSLVAAIPIISGEENIVGVAMFASELDDIAKEIRTTQFGNTGFTFLVDDLNQVVEHPDPTYSAELRDLSNYPPVAALRQGKRGLVEFTDEKGIRWRAYVNQLENGWGVIAQQTEEELTSSLRASQRVTIGAGLVGLFLLLGVVWLTVRQGLHPVQSLAETAAAIAEGNLTQEAPVESEDELGYLATSFNQMTSQLRESIASLEQRVSDRTLALERRASQMEAAARVAREAAGIRDIQRMLSQTTQLISHYFGFYHAGIFILDDVREYAVLQAANSEGGQKLLAKGHKLRVGQVGIVGYVADMGQPRIALDVGEDAIFFNNPDLPFTRSEMALPLKIRDQVVGVLDVQSIEEAAFTEDDVEVVQVLADQIALALDNTRLLEESQRTLEELRTLYGQQTRQAWRDRLKRGAISFRYTRMGSTEEVEGGEGGFEKDLTGVLKPEIRTRGDQQEILVPIMLHEQSLGMLVLRRDKSQKPWSNDELNLASDLITQVMPALENARLLDEIQARAQMESLVSQVSGRIQSSLDLETVLKTAVQEIGLALNANRVQIQLENELKGVDSHDG